MSLCPQSSPFTSKISPTYRLNRRGTPLSQSLDTPRHPIISTYQMQPILTDEDGDRPFDVKGHHATSLLALRRIDPRCNVGPSYHEAFPHLPMLYRRGQTASGLARRMETDLYNEGKGQRVGQRFPRLCEGSLRMRHSLLRPRFVQASELQAQGQAIAKESLWYPLSLLITNSPKRSRYS